MKPVLVIGLLCSLAAQAADIQLVAATQGKATVIIDGGRPKTLKVGDKAGAGIELLRADAAGAEFRTTDGKTRRIPIGGVGRVGGTAVGTGAAAAGQGSGARMTLQADSRGHFYAQVSFNGISARGLIDTGASGIALSSRLARTLGLDYKRGQAGYASTAAGYAPFYRVTLNEVRLGDIVLYNVPAAVLEGDFPQEPLLGNSMLNQLNMERQGDQLILSKRF